MKKIISTVTAFVMLMVLCIPLSINANAEGNINIYEKYTMEEFLALSEEEVCSISERTAEQYKRYKEDNEELFKDYLDPDIIEWPVDLTEKHIQVACLDLYITDELLTEMDDYYNEYGIEKFQKVYLPNLFSSSSDDWCYRINILGNKQVCSLYFDGPPFIEINTSFLDMETKNFDDKYSMSAKLAIWFKSLPGALDFEFRYNLIGGGQRVNFGDINTDGKISICDIIMLSKYNAGGVILNDYQNRCADCNNDGEVNDLDTYALMSYIVNLTDKLPYKS